MLYRLGKTNGVFDSLEALPFHGVQLEKHLEDLLAKSLLDLLCEGNELLPIFQERKWQAEADYQCRKCGVQVQMKATPSSSGRSKASFHQWTRL